MLPRKCNNGSSTLSSNDLMQPDHHQNQKSAIATTTSASAVAAASSASPLFPTSLHHHFQQMHQEGFDHALPPNDDFIEQMLLSLNSTSAWEMKAGCENDSASPEEEEEENGVSAGGFQFDESSKLRAQQTIPMRFDGMHDVVHRRGSLLEGSSYDSFHPGVENQMAGLFNRSFVGSLLGSGQQMNHLLENFQGSQGEPCFDQIPVAMNSNGQATMDGDAGAASAQPKQRVRAKRGQATDPHSIAERLRRERIAERMKGLQELVPNANKTDKASMLDEIIEYVKFLQLQVKVLSMSRLGGAGVGAAAPLVGDNTSSEGGCNSLTARPRAMMRREGSNVEVTATSTEEATPNSTVNNTEVNENQVAKLLEEDMGSAMQYLQSKGLCLMPISLAAAISTARNPLSSSSSTKRAGTNSSPITTSDCNVPDSPKC